MFQIDQKTILWLRKSKILCRGHVISDLNGEKIVGTFYEKELQKTNQKKFKIEKVIKRKGDKFMLSEKDTIIGLIAGQIEKT